MAVTRFYLPGFLDLSVYLFSAFADLVTLTFDLLIQKMMRWLYET